MQTNSLATIFIYAVTFSAVLSVSSLPDTSVLGRIVNGRDARIQDFPFQVSLRRHGVHICGGSVLNTNWVLTAAHCVEGFKDNPMVYTLRIGSEMRSSGGKIILVTSIRIHPLYNNATMNHDVALLRTAENELDGDHVRPIKLPDVAETIGDGSEAIVSGWGHMSSLDEILSENLKQTTVYIVNQAKCNISLSHEGGITDAMFCAAAQRTDACQGDSGGPIQAKGKLFGVVSWGIGCAHPSFPGVYARIASSGIRQWIRMITKV